MEKRYLLLKCGSGSKSLPIDCFTASNMTEAQEALKWLQQHHPERKEFQLGPGEFFELLVEEHCSPEEWEGALAELERNRRKKSS